MSTMENICRRTHQNLRKDSNVQDTHKFIVFIDTNHGKGMEENA
jgi:hypothetical protein